MKALNLANKWVLVTGASSGLGYEMACQLANIHRSNLIIAARRADKLQQLKTKLETEAGIKVIAITADLSVMDDVDRLINTCLEQTDLYGAILNAGVTYFGKHSELSWEKFQALVQTNIMGVVRMTNLLTRHFETTGKEGGIMLVSSMAGLVPVPYQSAYSGTKSFLISFATALSHELTNPRLSLTVFAPGGIVTEMTATEEFSTLQKWLMPVDETAREALKSFITRRRIYVPGFLNRLSVKLLKFLPNKPIIARVGETYRKALAATEAKHQHK